MQSHLEASRNENPTDEAKEFYSGELKKNQTKKVSNLIKSFSLNSLSSTINIRNKFDQIDRVTFHFKEIGNINKVLRFGYLSNK
jgi:hypothetical protein